MNFKQPPLTQPPPGALEQALQQAAMALQHRRPADAERMANDLLKNNPGDPRVLQLLGYALLVQGRGKDAIAPLEQAARITNDPAVETQLAMALRRAGRTDAALQRFAAALERQPPFPPAFLEFGNMLNALGRHDEAIDVLNRGLALAPNFAELQVQLGHVFVARGDHAKAREAFARALALAPQHTDAMFGLARALQIGGDFAQGADTFRRLLAIEPGDAASRIGLGVCLLELGQFDAGIDSLRLAAQTGPKMYGEALTALVSSGHGRFWLHPSEAERHLQAKKT